MELAVAEGGAAGEFRRADVAADCAIERENAGGTEVGVQRADEREIHVALHAEVERLRSGERHRAAHRQIGLGGLEARAFHAHLAFGNRDTNGPVVGDGEVRQGVCEVAAGQRVDLDFRDVESGGHFVGRAGGAANIEFAFESAFHIEAGVGTRRGEQGDERVQRGVAEFYFCFDGIIAGELHRAVPADGGVGRVRLEVRGHDGVLRGGEKPGVAEVSAGEFESVGGGVGVEADEVLLQLLFGVVTEPQHAVHVEFAEAVNVGLAFPDEVDLIQRHGVAGEIEVEVAVGEGSAVLVEVRADVDALGTGDEEAGEGAGGLTD